MKQFKHKKLLAIGGLGLGVVLLTSCTANFCSVVDQAAMAYPYDQGATVYLSKAEYEDLKQNGPQQTKDLITLEESWSMEAADLGLGLPGIAGPAFLSADGSVLNENVYKYIPFTGTGDALNFSAYKTNGFLKNFLTTATNSGYSLPGLYYFALLDDYALKAATTEFLVTTVQPDYRYANSTEFETRVVADATLSAKLSDVYAGIEMADKLTSSFIAVNPYTESDPQKSPTEIPTEKSILRQNGKVKFTGHQFNASGALETPFFGHIKTWNEEIRKKAIEIKTVCAGLSFFNEFDIPGIDFVTYYQNQISAKVNSVRSCIATRDGYFGHYGTFADWRVSIESKNWGYAWGKGFLEGLLVYPVTWLLDTMSYSFDPMLTGVGQIWALVLVTLIVRGLILALSFRTTIDNQKMQALQPELAKLQQKYPNANTNQAEKQRMSQEQMMLYKRNGIRPFRQIIVMIVQFPVFIAVWAGLQGSAALSTGEFLKMRLSDNINSILFNTTGTWYYNTTGWWTALVLFILMAFTQIMAMLLPRIITKFTTKGVAKTVKSNTAKQQNNTMKWVSYGLIIFTIVMGFFLPSAMGIYWLIGGLISMVQTLVTQLIMLKAKKGKK